MGIEGWRGMYWVYAVLLLLRRLAAAWIERSLYICRIVLVKTLWWRGCMIEEEGDGCADEQYANGARIAEGLIELRRRDSTK